MPATFVIGKCPGCGSDNSQLRVTSYKALLDRGTSDPICRACEQRAIGKVIAKAEADMRRKGFKQADIDKALEALREKVKPVEEVEPAPTTPAAPVKPE